MQIEIIYPWQACSHKLLKPEGDLLSQPEEAWRLSMRWGHGVQLLLFLFHLWPQVVPQLT